MPAPLSPIRWKTAKSKRWDALGVPVRLEGYNWKRKVLLHVLAGPGRGGTFYAHAIDLAHDNGDQALNAALARLPYLSATSGKGDPGAPVKGQPAPRAPVTDIDPLEGALL